MLGFLPLPCSNSMSCIIVFVGLSHFILVRFLVCAEDMFQFFSHEKGYNADVQVWKDVHGQELQAFYRSSEICGRCPTSVFHLSLEVEQDSTN